MYVESLIEPLKTPTDPTIPLQPVQVERSDYCSWNVFWLQIRPGATFSGYIPSKWWAHALVRNIGDKLWSAPSWPIHVNFLIVLF